MQVTVHNMAFVQGSGERAFLFIQREFRVYNLPVGECLSLP